MYDNVKFWIDRAIVGDQIYTIANYLDNAKDNTDHNTGEIDISFGTIENLRVEGDSGKMEVVATWVFNGTQS